MKRSFLSLLLLVITTMALQAQLSSADVRQASGHGPYPMTISFQGVAANSNNMFSGFIRTYNAQHGTHNLRALIGSELNFNFVIVNNNFMWIKNWVVRGFTMGVGYRYLYRNLRNGDGERIHLQEEVIGLRLGKRINIIYPITCEFLAGPTIYNFYTMSRHMDLPNGGATTFFEERVRYGNGLFERNKLNHELCSGIDLKIRLKLFDPAGTEGGMGGYLEWGKMITFGSRNLDRLYDTFLGVETHDTRSWDYGYISAGLIFPLAIRMVSK